MNDLRRDINAVFEKQRGQLGDVTSASTRLPRAASAGRRVNRQLWPSVAGVALVLVAASAIGVSIVIRGQHSKDVVTHHSTPTPTATPAPTPVATPMSQPLQVPEATPVILFQDSVDRQQLDGVTWDGSARGRVGRLEAGMGFVSNPAGTLYGWTSSVYDRSGAVVGTVPASPYTKSFPGTWADDGRHICSMFSESPFGQVGGKPTTLQLTTVGKETRNVVQVGRVYEQTSIGVAASAASRRTARLWSSQAASAIRSSSGWSSSPPDASYGPVQTAATFALRVRDVLRIESAGRGYDDRIRPDWRGPGPCRWRSPDVLVGRYASLDRGLQRSRLRRPLAGWDGPLERPERRLLVRNAGAWRPANRSMGARH